MTDYQEINYDGYDDEYTPGADTDPLNPDTDLDEYVDGIDTFPLDPNEWSDRDGVGDNSDVFPDNPERSEEESINILTHETNVTDGKLNATMEFIGLESNSTYYCYAVLYNNDWTVTMGEKWLTPVNGTLDIEVDVAGNSGADCHF